MNTSWWLLLVLWPGTASAEFPSSESNACPEHEQYTSCSSSSCFEAVCNVASTLLCTRDCKAGCQCIKGFARRGTICVSQEECTASSAIIWKSAGTPGPMGVLRLQSDAGRCVTVSALAADEGLYMQDCDKTSDLQLDFRADGVIRSSAQPGLCLAANSSGQAKSGDRVVLAACADVANQKFQTNREDGTIRLPSSDALCIDNKAPSAVVNLKNCADTSEQQWELQDNGCVPAQAVSVTDYGFSDNYRGWYDIQGCGSCHDYCRWVGSASGGDPTLNQLAGVSHWSCALAGSDREFTLPGYFQSWNYSKCSNIISNEDVRRSAAAPDPNAVIQAELPVVPRSVPRRRPHITASPTHSLTSVTNASNVTGANVTTAKMAAAAQPLGIAKSSPSPLAYAIPLGIIGGLLLLGALAFLCYRLYCKKGVETSVASPKGIAVISAPVQIVAAPFAVAAIPAPNDSPPPYDAEDPVETTHLTLNGSSQGL